MKRPDRRAFKRSFLTSFARLIGVGLAAGAGTLIKSLVGDGFHGWALAIGMAIVSFVLMWYAEYKKEIE